MVNYGRGKIYEIISNNKPELSYVGSTCAVYLSQRFAEHNGSYNRYSNGTDKKFCKSYDVLQHGDCTINLIENYPCNSKEELLARERFYIQSRNCVNKVIPLRTPKEYYNDHRHEIIEKNKAIYKANRSIIVEKKKAKYRANRDIVIEKVKKYQEKNKDKFLEKKKAYYEVNKVKLLEKRKVNAICPCCFREVKKYDINRHMASNVCLKTQMKLNKQLLRVAPISEIIDKEIIEPVNDNDVPILVMIEAEIEQEQNN